MTLPKKFALNALIIECGSRLQASDSLSFFIFHTGQICPLDFSFPLFLPFFKLIFGALTLGQALSALLVLRLKEHAGEHLSMLLQDNGY